LTFEGANADARVEGRSVRPEPAHFFRGRDPAGWRTDVPVVDTVVWRDLYPGIDAFAHWSRNGLEYDFEVAAGAAVEEIVVRVDGVTTVVAVEEGLRLETPVGVISHGPPVSFASGDRARPIASSIRRIDACRWGFEVAGQGEEGVEIDPVLEFSTYVGGLSAADRAFDVAYAPDGGVVASGFTSSPDFPVTPGAYRGTLQFLEVYVAKLVPDGTQLAFCTFVGGSIDEEPTRMALHSDGSVYVIG